MLHPGLKKMQSALKNQIKKLELSKNPFFHKYQVTQILLFCLKKMQSGIKIGPDIAFDNLSILQSVLKKVPDVALYTLIICSSVLILASGNINYCSLVQFGLKKGPETPNQVANVHQKANCNQKLQSKTTKKL